MIIWTNGSVFRLEEGDHFEAGLDCFDHRDCGELDFRAAAQERLVRDS
jgi:hypothetical protein